jgi:hypothetical protein
VLLIFFKHFMEFLLEYRVKSVLRGHPMQSYVSTTLAWRGACQGLTEQNCPIQQCTLAHFRQHHGDKSSIGVQTAVARCVLQTGSCTPNFQKKDPQSQVVVGPVARYRHDKVSNIDVRSMVDLNGHTGAGRRLEPSREIFPLVSTNR